MSEPVSAFPPVEQIAHAVIEAQEVRPGRWQLDPARSVRSVREWSVCYRFDLVSRTKRWPLFAKIPTAPDGYYDDKKLNRETDLRASAEAEFMSLTDVFNHFRRLGDPHLSSIRPVVLLDRVNALVMDQVEDRTLRDTCFSLRSLLGGVGRNRCREAMFHTGRWLSALHRANSSPSRSPGAEERRSLQDRLAAALEELGRNNVRLDRWPEWCEVTREISSTATTRAPVLCHNDFQCTNILVLSDGAIAGIDAKTSLGDRYRDIGRFLADLRTQRIRNLSRGRLPRASTITSLRTNFLAGYETAARLNQLSVLAHEVHWILDEWATSLNSMLARKKRGRELPIAGVRRRIVNPAYLKMIDDWLFDVVQLNGERGLSSRAPIRELVSKYIDS